MIKIATLFIISIALIVGSFTFLQGYVVGALPLTAGIFMFVATLGELMNPFTDNLFKED